MSTPPGGFYSGERWENWIERLRAEDLDPEDEEFLDLQMNLQDDVAIAVAKIVSACDDGDVDEDDALEELTDVREVVLEEVTFDDEDAAMLVDEVQTSLVCAFASAEEYIVGGPAEEAPIEEFVRAGADAEAEEDLDEAFTFCVGAGTRIIAGDEFDIELVDDLEFGHVAVWVNGLDSLYRALQDPEVVEEDEEAADDD
jgi:hypothetical protein